MQTSNTVTETLIDDYLYQNNYRYLGSKEIEGCARIYVRDGKEALIFSGDSVEYKRQRKSTNPHIINVLFSWETVATYKGFAFTEFNLMMLLNIMGAVKISDVNKQLRTGVMMQDARQQINEMSIGNPVVDRNCVMA